MRCDPMGPNNLQLPTGVSEMTTGWLSRMHDQPFFGSSQTDIAKSTRGHGQSSQLPPLDSSEFPEIISPRRVLKALSHFPVFFSRVSLPGSPLPPPGFRRSQVTISHSVPPLAV